MSEKMMVRKQTTMQVLCQPKNLAEAMQLAKIFADTEMVPKDFRGKPHAILVAMQAGSEVGLAPLQSLQSIAAINGRPCLWGDGLLAVVMSHPDFVDIIETFEIKTKTAKCIVKRRGRSDKMATFSWSDAENAKVKVKSGSGYIALADKDTYKSYPKRMLQMRARGFALRDQFSDAIKGIGVAEEVQDYDVVEVKDVTPPDVSLTEVLDAIGQANDPGELDGVIVAAATLDDDERQEAREAFRRKSGELKQQEAPPDEGRMKFSRDGELKPKEEPKPQQTEPATDWSNVGPPPLEDDSEWMKDK